LHLVGCLYYLYQWCTVKQISDNEIYLLIKYKKGVLWRVVKRLSYKQDARCLKVNELLQWNQPTALKKKTESTFLKFFCFIFRYSQTISVFIENAKHNINMCPHRTPCFTYRIAARLKWTLRYKIVLSFMQNKQQGNSVF